MHYHWTTPLDLNLCRSRIQAHHEEASLLATRYQTRLVTEVWEVDAGTLGFRLYRAPKSSMQITLGGPAIQLRGAIQRRADHGCDIVFESHVSAFSYLGTAIVPAFFVGTFLLSFNPGLREAPAFFALLWVVGTLLGVGLFYLWIEFQQSSLLDTLRQVCGVVDHTPNVRKKKRDDADS